jgi:hypothetical protein
LVVREPQLASFTPAGCVGRAIEWTQGIPDMQVNGQSLLELLRYDGTSLWWFIQTLVFSSAKRAILNIERIERLLKDVSPSQVLIVGLGDLDQLAAYVCRGEKVGCTISDRWGLFKSENLTDETKITMGRVLMRVKEFRRRRAAKHARGAAPAGPRVLFLSPSGIGGSNWRAVWSYEKDRYVMRDSFMGRVMDEMQSKGFEVIGVDVDYSLNGHVGLLKEKVLNGGIKWLAFEQYLPRAIGAKLESNPDYVQLSHTFDLLSQSETFQKSLEYHSIPLWGFMRSRFRRALSSVHALYYPRLIEAAREMICVEQPDAIAMSYETGAYARAVIVAAWERKIPTLGVQHGFITPDSVEYIHMRTSGSDYERACPIPTKTVLGGQYSAELLTKLSSYPEDSVAITGYTKHDDLAELKHNEATLDREKLLKGLGLSPGAKTIMIASGGFHSKYGWIPEYDREVLERMVNLSTSRPDIQLLVRLHPMEDGAMQREVTEGGPGKAAIVKGERNDLLWASDILVTVNSVVALDALILGKPVMMLEGASEDVSTVDLGKAAILYTLENLNERVTNLIETSRPSDQMRKEMQLEISRHANSVDGRASYRVAALLKELAANHSRLTE